jgi:tellurite resistance protein TerC
LNTPWQLWAAFGAAIVFFLCFDLFVLHRRPKGLEAKSALAMSATWIGVALLFNFWIYAREGREAGLQFLTAYLVEKSLSVDNVLAFLLIFRSFDIKPEFQHRVLFWGVLGALVLRGIFVVAGVEMIRAFHWVSFLFGGILLIAGIRMLIPHGEVEPERNLVVRLARKWSPFAPDETGEKFWVRRSGKWLGTPLLLALVAVETSDVLFAIDSVPAVIAITQDPFLVYSSNLFAILGLRSLYCAVAGLLPKVRYLHHGLAAILVFVGLKMIATDYIHIEALVSLAVIAGILAMTMAVSVVAGPQRSRSTAEAQGRR